MNVQIPENEAVLAYLSLTGPKVALVSPADSARDPYMELGSHPEVVERVWDQLGSSLSPESRQIVYGRPALVHPNTGVVFALAWGTRYVLKLSQESVKKARDAGYETVQKSSDGAPTEVEPELGPQWIFGRWSPLEILWLQESYAPFHGSGQTQSD